ncbi:hypothetical protein BDN70DRAFT_617338 [Pholiota conissans]|uniref:Uncharacterized protein n=1 Tax=Pholiota conissans TaxID=109636 RepID=A0A9P5YJG9_9AGAR|nr:hypothetical protein BDN70DRAFT_617338 [Pholiota conissans]
MAPLAGKPPFATDEPDSYYETPRAPQPRLRQPKPEDPNKRSSAYDVYDNYLKEDGSKLAAPAAGSSNRNSGLGNLLMNMDDDSDDDSDDEDGSYRRHPAVPPGISPPMSKNAALAAATGVSSTPGTPTRRSPPPQQMDSPSQTRSPGMQQPPAPQQMQQNYPQQQQQQQFSAQAPNQQHHMQPIAAPRPGYAAPIAALNLARPEPAVVPAGRQAPGMPMPMHKGPPAPIQIPSNNNHNPFGGPGGFPMPASPAPSAPHPLQPPVTPITPAFIRPSGPGGVVNVSFAGLDEKEGKAIPRKPIMRGNSEETLLPSRGEKGDDFWRRFSMVVKEESKKGTKESSWLHKTRSGTQAYSRWVWIIGIILLICIAGGIGVGVYLTRNSPSHQQPTAIGGSADNLATGTSTSTVSGNGGKTTSSSLHVSPTLTVARREAVVTPRAAAVPTQVLRRHRDMKNRNMSSW